MIPPASGLAFATGVLLLVCAAFGLAVHIGGGLASAAYASASGLVAGMHAWARMGADDVREEPSTADVLPGRIEPDRSGGVIVDLDEAALHDEGAARPLLERVSPARRP